MPSLIIEDGSVVAGADSFVSAADLILFAGQYGLAIPTDEISQEALLRRAALAMQAIAWKGTVTDPLQPLVWPRTDVLVNGAFIASNVIPGRIVNGQMMLVAEIHAENQQAVATEKGAVIEETVSGAVTIKYSDTARRSITPVFADRPSFVQFVDFTRSRGFIQASRA